MTQDQPLYPFIALEGLPGTGKTTLRDALVKALGKLGVGVHHVGQHSWLAPQATPSPTPWPGCTHVDLCIATSTMKTFSSPTNAPS
jgi:predicted ATPase